MKSAAACDPRSSSRQYFQTSETSILQSADKYEGPEHRRVVGHVGDGDCDVSSADEPRRGRRTRRGRRHQRCRRRWWRKPVLPVRRERPHRPLVMSQERERQRIPLSVLAVKTGHTARECPVAWMGKKEMARRRRGSTARTAGTTGGWGKTRPLVAEGVLGRRRRGRGASHLGNWTGRTTSRTKRSLPSRDP